MIGRILFSGRKLGVLKEALAASRLDGCRRRHSQEGLLGEIRAGIGFAAPVAQKKGAVPGCEELAPMNATSPHEVGVPPCKKSGIKFIGTDHTDSL